MCLTFRDKKPPSVSINSGVITLAFFQLEIHGGIFHSCCSLTVIYNKKEKLCQAKYLLDTASNFILIFQYSMKLLKSRMFPTFQHLYLSAWGMHDRGRGRRRSSGNLLVDPETYNYIHQTSASFSSD